MAAKLIIDLARCETQAESGVQCSYSQHPGNKGFDSLLEMIRFALICRKCAAAPCVRACPRDALEKVLAQEREDEGVLKRATMLCTGCGTCAIACPFGTIYTDLIPFPGSVCDLCAGRLAAGEKPLCVQTCRNGEIEYGDVAVAGDMTEVFPGVLVRSAESDLWTPQLKEKA